HTGAPPGVPLPPAAGVIPHPSAVLAVVALWGVWGGAARPATGGPRTPQQVQPISHERAIASAPSRATDGYRPL
ncbi:MAG: hypothetical protein ACHQ4H_10770, partial [Ktedonobacterales bacterium]